MRRSALWSTTPCQLGLRRLLRPPRLRQNARGRKNLARLLRKLCTRDSACCRDRMRVLAMYMMRLTVSF